MPHRNMLYVLVLTPYLAHHMFETSVKSLLVGFKVRPAVLQLPSLFVLLRINIPVYSLYSKCLLQIANYRQLSNW